MIGKGGKFSLTDILVYLIIIVFSAVYAFMSVQKHNSFQTFGWDLAVFDHGIWQWSQFKIPYSSFHDLPWLADHFNPILITIAPFYWIWTDVRLLLIIQAILVCFGALPLYYLSKKVTSHNLFSLTIVLGYVLFYSLQSFIFSDFHDFAFLPLTLGAILVFWEYKMTFLYWFFFLLALLVKEEVGLLLAAIGVWGLFYDRSRWKQSLLTFVLGTSYTLLMLTQIMPFIGGLPYRHSGFGQSGESIQDVIFTILTNPLYLINAFGDSEVKINTILNTFWPWGFLPIFSPATLILVLEQFASRFLDYGKPIRWTLLFVYSLPMATIMAWGSIYGFANIAKIVHKTTGQSKKLISLLLTLILLILIISEDLLLHGPIHTFFKSQFYYKENWINDNLQVLECVPEDVSVSAQNSLAPWLSQREKIKVFPEGLGFDYIVLDLHSGQSENSFHFLGRENTRIVTKDLIEKGYYEIICQSGSALALKRKIDPPYELNYSFKLNIYEK